MPAYTVTINTDRTTNNVHATVPPHGLFTCSEAAYSDALATPPDVVRNWVARLYRDEDISINLDRIPHVVLCAMYGDLYGAIRDIVEKRDE